MYTRAYRFSSVYPCGSCVCHTAKTKNVIAGIVVMRTGYTKIPTIYDDAEQYTSLTEKTTYEVSIRMNEGIAPT